MRKFRKALIGAVLLASTTTVVSAQAPAQPATPVGPVSSPRVMMLRVFVADIARAEKFYHEVFGMITAQKMGDMVRIMIFPSGALPGIILIQSPQETTMNGSWVMQVPDVKATLDRAVANGGVAMNTRFAQKVEGQSAQSTHFTDPDGNVIELLQIGGAARPK
jgi:predicted enzyme related to lactoylglutathione lyase